MFIRIVKLTLLENKVNDFLEHFDTIKDKVRHYPGCQFLEVYRDRVHSNIFFTYSYWEDESDLESYKKSEIFGEIWPYTKTLFKDKAEAWSVDKVVTLK
ncbi:antibiotic biosynthesis monooxygenase family protein [Myroides odoratimimus]|uniref:putative quinol monooxygenase n=1 Tax=Myroides odoratimimus TaxID=76832 RepID=UPI00310165AF